LADRARLLRVADVYMFTVYWDMTGCWYFYNFNRPIRWQKHLRAQKVSFVQYLEIRLVSRRQLQEIHTTLKNTEKEEVGADCTGLGNETGRK
jgi:hypothetical protein